MLSVVHYIACTCARSMLLVVVTLFIFIYLCSLISQIDHAINENEIDQILEDPAKMAIVNSSRWPVTKLINMNTKSELVQEIMVGRAAIKERRQH